MVDKSKRGKLARASGARFELKVRSDLESQGWIMDKWTNNVDLQIGKMVKANGWLDRKEKEKCKWLLDKKIFGEIRIAKKGKKRGEIEYINFAEKYGI